MDTLMLYYAVVGSISAVLLLNRRRVRRWMKIED
jgi:hypothetical protein